MSGNEPKWIRFFIRTSLNLVLWGLPSASTQLVCPARPAGDCGWGTGRRMPHQAIKQKEGVHVLPTTESRLSSYVLQAIFDRCRDVQAIRARVFGGNEDILACKSTFTDCYASFTFIPIRLRGVYKTFSKWPRRRDERFDIPTWLKPTDNACSTWSIGPWPLPIFHVPYLLDVQRGQSLLSLLFRS